MNGDRTLSGGTNTQPTVTDSDGVEHTDSAGLEGFLLEQQTFDGPSGPELSRVINDPVRRVTATHTTDQGRTVTAGTPRTATTRRRAPLAGGGFRSTRVDNSYDDYGNLIEVNDHGDVA
jgi:hypothetical protein